MIETKKRILAAAMAVLLAVPMLCVFAAQSASADITNDSKGEIIVQNVQDNEDFTAVRFIETAYDGTITRAFADGFSYGDNSSNRSDDGLSAYLSLSDNAAIAEAVEGFSKQITDSSEAYHAVASDGTARFEDLPMGHYIIIGTSNDGSRVYQRMLANVEPTYANGTYSIVPFEIKAKYEGVQLGKSDLEIEKTSDVDSIYRYADVNYTVIVNPTSDSAAVRNVHVLDALDEDTIAQGMQLNQDVKVTFPNGEEVDDATIVYTNLDGSTVGYSIDILGEFSPETVFIITYSGNTEDLSDNPRVVNMVQAWCDDVDPVDAVLTIEGDEETIDPEITPLEQFFNQLSGVADELIMQTGDKLPFIIGGIAVIAIVAIVAIRRKRKDK